LIDLLSDYYRITNTFICGIRLSLLDSKLYASKENYRKLYLLGAKISLYYAKKSLF